MTRALAHRLKPRASARLQLALAGALWSVVGAGLLAAGARWTLGAVPGAAGAGLLLIGVAAGLLKGRFVLDRAAARIAGRIEERGDGRCIGGFLSVRSWLLVAVMMTAGRILRGGLLPPAAVGPLYAAIGSGLLLSSRVPWRRARAAGAA